MATTQGQMGHRTAIRRQNKWNSWIYKGGMC